MPTREHSSRPQVQRLKHCTAALYVQCSPPDIDQFYPTIQFFGVDEMSINLALELNGVPCKTDYLVMT